MPATLRRLDEAHRHATRLRREIGEELRDARIAAGLSQVAVARALGCAPSTISRVERGEWPKVSIVTIVRYAVIVGHVVRVAMYPIGAPIRDAGQVRLLNRLKQHLPSPPWDWALEGPVRTDDLRAFDAIAANGSARIGFDAWTHIRDLQAQVRASMRKAADSGVDRLVLVLADTRHNRAAVAEAGNALREAFPATTRQVLAALRAGKLPSANGIVFL